MPDPDTADAAPAQAAASHLRVEHHPDGACWITIDRAAKHNALARPVLAELAATVRELGARPQLRYLVIRGAGERYFAAGGAELALACDLRLQAAHARIGYIQSRLAITSAWGGGPDLFRLVGPARALRMMARAELVEAETALAWGLADAVIRDGADGEDLRAFTRPLASSAPQVLRGIKAQAQVARLGPDWAAHRQVEREHFVRTWLHEDHWAAADKLLSKGT